MASITFAIGGYGKSVLAAAPESPWGSHRACSPGWPSTHWPTLRSPRRGDAPCPTRRVRTEILLASTDVISGSVHPDFGGVTQALRKVGTHKRGGGAAVAVFHEGKLVVDAWTGARDASGAPWQSDTMAMSFSTTKGVTAT
jgi:CubicO group peptidase (beta-lactamase class C family)